MTCINRDRFQELSNFYELNYKASLLMLYIQDGAQTTLLLFFLIITNPNLLVHAEASPYVLFQTRTDFREASAASSLCSKFKQVFIKRPESF